MLPFLRDPGIGENLGSMAAGPIEQLQAILKLAVGSSGWSAFRLLFTMEFFFVAGCFFSTKADKSIPDGSFVCGLSVSQGLLRSMLSAVPQSLNLVLPCLDGSRDLFQTHTILDEASP